VQVASRRAAGARLADHHAHALDVADQVELAQRAQRVQLELRVVLGGHLDAAAELQVDDDDLVAAQDDASPVPSAPSSPVMWSIGRACSTNSSPSPSVVVAHRVDVGLTCSAKSASTVK
jgi:hypothetical protein